MSSIMEKHSINCDSLEAFVTQMDAQQQTALRKIKLFQKSEVSQWTIAQKRYFAAIFYHSRGHFHDFLWFLANFASHSLVKKIVLSNIEEEFNTNGLSHERLYELFANEFDVNIIDEIIHETHYLPFVREFNKGHLQWLSAHSPEEQLAAFAAYERLDNIDYPYLLNFAENLGVSKKGLIFFSVHVHVEHFSSTLEALFPIWERNKEIVMNAFDFIYAHQRMHWQKLSKIITEYEEPSLINEAINVDNVAQVVS